MASKAAEIANQLMKEEDSDEESALLVKSDRQSELIEPEKASN